jgi:hypothetical protein
VLKKLKQSIVTLIASVAFLAPVAAPVMVHAQVPANDINTGLCSGLNTATGTTDSCSATDADATTGIGEIIKTIINIFSIIVGAAAVIMIIYGGFRYITSGGDSGKVGNAKNTIIYALIGLIIVALAQVIVRFVLTKATV